MVSRDVEAGVGQDNVKERIFLHQNLWRAARTTLWGDIQPDASAESERPNSYQSSVDELLYLA